MACILLVRRSGVPDGMRAISRRLINPLVLRYAGGRLSPHAVIYHVGRRTGRQYRTPVVVLPSADGFIITLTYGERTDWYRNMRAMSQVNIRWHGQHYRVSAPVLLDARRAAADIPPLIRFVSRLLGLSTYIEVKRF